MTMEALTSIHAYRVKSTVRYYGNFIIGIIV